MDTLPRQEWYYHDMTTATAQAFANIAFIKYWGNIDPYLNLPANGSISMNLESLQTTTQVEFDDEISLDMLLINGSLQSGGVLDRAIHFLDHVRELAGVNLHARISSTTNFPISAGLASSASAYAALALASTQSLGLSLSEKELSILARLGSGSAARSIPGGYVEWHPADVHEDSYAESIAGPDHWDLVDVIAIVQEQAKETASSLGHILADTSPIQLARVASTPDRLNACRKAILERDFSALVEVVELDCTLMHAAMMTSTPPLF